MRLLSNLFSILCLAALCSAAILLPRAPKGGGGGGSGGGGHGSGGGGRGGGGGGGGGRSGGSGRSSSSSGTGRGGSGDTGSPAISYGVVSTGNRNANYFGGGGGRPFTLSGSSVFAGRQMGGGIRVNVPGTRAYGSGYPYYVGDVDRTGVTGQPFPFGFWPIYWTGHGHSDEYGANATVAAQRPGGDQVLVQLTPNLTESTWNTTVINGVNETYWMIGDTNSVTTILSILTDPNTTSSYGCGVQNLTIESFNSSNPLVPVHFENVIQWYRASSFALAFTGYNNSYAFPPLNETSDLGWDDSTPLPDALQYSPFLQCINETISAALPIIDQDPPPLSQGQIAGIVVGSMVGALLLCCCACPCFFALKEKIEVSRRRKKSKPVVEKAVVQGKQAYIVKDSRAKDCNFEKVPLSSQSPPHSPGYLKPSGINSARPSYATTTYPKAASTKPGRESVHSSHTLIEESGSTYGRDKNPYSFSK